MEKEAMNNTIVPIAVVSLLLAACTATVDKTSVQATQATPVSAQVPSVTIPYDASQPMYVVTVEPLSVGASSGGGVTQASSGGNYGWGPWGFMGGGRNPAPGAYTPQPQGMSDRVGQGIAAQLISALGKSGNVVVIDYETYRQKRNSGSVMVRPGEVGPFVIKGAVTEFNEVAEANEDRKGGSLGWMGTVAGIAGAVAGVPGVGIAGAAVSAANPTYENTKARRTGSVGMDLQVVEPDSGRMLGTIVSHGTFTAESATSGFSVFGMGGGQSAFAASALGQATRSALNDTVKQLTDQLRAKGGSYAPAPGSSTGR
jgi:curli biogenesis system outer membrane secretion channel CsgG